MFLIKNHKFLFYLLIVVLLLSSAAPTSLAKSLQAERRGLSWFACEGSDRQCNANIEDCVDSECVCKPGLGRDPDCSHEIICPCVDINECVEPSPDYSIYPCPLQGSYCVDYDPPERFKCGCLDGFQAQLPDSVAEPVPLEWRPVSCVNINECEEVNSPCHSTLATCTDTIGSYMCHCIDGYTGDGVNCVVDTNAPSECRPGYAPVISSGEGSDECQDIDECFQDPYPCNYNAECKNSPGSFTCECLPGYEGEGCSLNPPSEEDYCEEGWEVCCDMTAAECTSEVTALQARFQETIIGDPNWKIANGPLVPVNFLLDPLIRSETTGTYLARTPSGVHFSFTVLEIIETFSDMLGTNDPDLTNSATQEAIGEYNQVATTFLGQIGDSEHGRFFGTVNSFVDPISNEFFGVMYILDEVAVETSTRRDLQEGILCSGAFFLAESAFPCPNGGSLETDEACKSNIVSACEVSINLYRGEYDTTISVARATFDAVKLALVANKGRKIAVFTNACILSVLSVPIPQPPMIVVARIAGCIAVRIIIMEAQNHAIKLSAKAAFDFAVAKAIEKRDILIKAATDTVTAQADACFDCCKDGCCPACEGSDVCCDGACSNECDDDDEVDDDEMNDDQVGDDQMSDDETGDDQIGDDQVGDDQMGDDQMSDDQMSDDQLNDDQTDDDSFDDDTLDDDSFDDDTLGDDGFGDDGFGDDNFSDDQIDDQQPDDPCSGNCDEAITQGDPHFFTFDRVRHSCQAGGEFILMQAVSSGAQVQARFEKKNEFVSLATAVAASGGTGTPTVQLSIPDSGVSFDVYVAGSHLTNPSNGYEDVDVVIQVHDSLTSIRFNGSGLIVDVTYVALGSFPHFSIKPRLPAAFRNETIRGLLGSPDDDPTNEWMTGDGQILPLPTDGGLSGKAAYDYCRTQWCIRDPSASLFLYESLELDFTSFDHCDEEYPGDVNLFGLSQELRDLCGEDIACLIDGLELGIEGAQSLLEGEASVGGSSTSAAFVIFPSAISVGLDSNLNMTINLENYPNLDTDDITEFQIVRIDSTTFESISEVLTVLRRVGNSETFTGFLAQTSSFAGESFSFAANPVGATSTSLIALNAVTAYSLGSGIGNDGASSFILTADSIDDLVLIVEYSWPLNQPDLDSATEFLGDSVGFGCAATNEYLSFGGDTTSSGGTEVAYVFLGDSNAAGLWSDQVSVVLNAGWYSSGGSGPATVTLFTSTTSEGLRTDDVVSFVVSPGQQSGCSDTIVGLVDITISPRGGVSVAINANIR